MKKMIERVNALTVDVEDYYQVEAFADVVKRDYWGRLESRVEIGVGRLLELFARRRVQATFFILGWLAERNGHLVRRIVEAGHEIACHSYHHFPISEHTPEQFRQDLRRAKNLLEDLTGRVVEGYRAPTYSIDSGTMWAVEVLIEEGFRYDSSIFPVRHDRYGVPGARRFPYIIRSSSGELVEFPPSTARIAGFNLPLAGGGYFRLLPYPVFRWGMNRINRRERQSAIFMVHAWEMDPEQPIINGTWLNIRRHRNNLHLTGSRLEKLLGDFRFSTVSEVLLLIRKETHAGEAATITANPAFARMD